MRERAAPPQAELLHLTLNFRPLVCFRLGDCSVRVVVVDERDVGGVEVGYAGVKTDAVLSAAVEAGTVRSRRESC